MVKFVILLLFVFTASYTQDFSVVDHYYDLLLKKWQKGGDGYQKLENIWSDEIALIQKTIEANYKINANTVIRENMYFLRASGERKHILVWVHGFPNDEQFWFLITEGVNVKVLVSHKDKRNPNMPTPRDEFQRWEANRVYEQLLKNMNSNTPNKCQPSRSHISTVQKNIDSVTAVTIAIKAAEQCFGPVTFIAARPMGDNKEHWMIYCIPIISIDPDTTRLWAIVTSNQTLNSLNAPPMDLFQQRYCNWVISNKYNHGRLFMGGTSMDAKCPKAIAVLISKQNGQVLFMK